MVEVERELRRIDPVGHGLLLPGERRDRSEKRLLREADVVGACDGGPQRGRGKAACFAQLRTEERQDLGSEAARQRNEGLPHPPHHECVGQRRVRLGLAERRLHDTLVHAAEPGLDEREIPGLDRLHDDLLHLDRRRDNGRDDGRNGRSTAAHAAEVIDEEVHRATGDEHWLPGQRPAVIGEVEPDYIGRVGGRCGQLGGDGDRGRESES